MRNAMKAVAAAVLAVAASSAADAAVVLQYGYDYTSGTVQGQGNVVLDDSGSGYNAASDVNPGGTDGGTYSPDIPAAVLRKNTTGIGSVDTSVGSHATSASNIITNAQVVAAGGLTFESWIKPSAGTNPTTDRQILSESGAMALETRGTGAAPPAGQIGVIWFMSGSNHRLDTTVPKGEWTHLAGEIRNPILQADGDIEGTLEFYVNGVLVTQRAASVMTTGADWPLNNTGATPLNRGTAVGNHPTVALNFQGLIYEPRISLGALDPSLFTVVVPEPGSLALTGLAGAGLLGRGRRRR